jgi:hypothetical protein
VTVPLTKFESTWGFGDRVKVDGCESIVGTITAFAFRVTRDPTVEVSYFNNGKAETGWFEQWRLAKAEK